MVGDVAVDDGNAAPDPEHYLSRRTLLGFPLVPVRDSRSGLVGEASLDGPCAFRCAASPRPGVGRGRDVLPRRGDKRAYRREAQATAILALINETPDSTLAEIVAHLQRRHGRLVARSTVRRLLDHHRLGFEKKRRTPPSSSDRTSGSGGWPGSRPSRRRRPSASSSSTRPVPRRRGPDVTAGQQRESAAGHRCRTAIGNRRQSPGPSGTPG